MQNVSAEFKAAVNAPTRNIKLYVMLIGKHETGYINARVYTSDDILMSLKIVDGQTNGGFSLGGTICPSLTVELYKTAIVNVGDKIMAKLLLLDIGSLTLASEFTVDTISRKPNGVWSVTALGNMIKLSKNYVSTLTYPATQLQVLEEIAAQTGYDLSNAVSSELINNPQIYTTPIKGKAEDGTTLYYTRREMLGYAAAINGGAAYIDQYGHINIARHNDTGEIFTHEQVFSENITDPFAVNSVRWNSTGLTYSLGDDFDENTVEFYNPLAYNSRELIAHNLETDLIGFKYDGAIIKKQGCGYYEVGDLIHYVDIGGAVHDLLVLGIVYEFADGYFAETLYSLTNSNTQRQYAGTEIVSNQIGGGQAQPITGDVGLSSYRYLSDTSIDYNGVVYVVEKDENGLITKITDDVGGEFAPDVDGVITDIAYHNAVFTAVAMLGGLPRPLADTLTPMVQYRYNAESLTQSDTTISLLNQANGGDVPAVFTGATKSDNSVYIAGTEASHGEMAWNTENSEYTIYLVARCESVNALRIVDTQGNAGSSPTGAVIYGQGGGIWRAAAYNGGTAVNSGIPQTQLAVLAVRMSAVQFDFFANGAHIGSAAQTSRLLPGVHYFDYGHRWGADNPGGCYYYDIAFAVTAHSDADIIKNSKYLMRKYSIT